MWLQVHSRKNSGGHMGWTGRRLKTEAIAILRRALMTTLARSVTKAGIERKAWV